MSSDSDTPLADGQRFDIRPLLAATARRLEMELKNWPTKEAFDLARLLLADLDLRMSTGDSREIAMARVIRDHSLLAEGLAAYCPICGTEQECPACDSIAHCPTCGEEKGCLKCERVEPVSCPACGTDTVREE